MAQAPKILKSIIFSDTRKELLMGVKEYQSVATLLFKIDIYIFRDNTS